MISTTFITNMSIDSDILVAIADIVTGHTIDIKLIYKYDAYNVFINNFSITKCVIHNYIRKYTPMRIIDWLYEHDIYTSDILFYMKPVDKYTRDVIKKLVRYINMSANTLFYSYKPYDNYTFRLIFDHMKFNNFGIYHIYTLFENRHMYNLDLVRVNIMYVLAKLHDYFILHPLNHVALVTQFTRLRDILTHDDVLHNYMISLFPNT